MGSWFIAKESLVDFLTFCFALNTMFSFSKIRNRLLFYLKKGLNKSLDSIQFWEIDFIESIPKNFPKGKKEKICECVGVSDCADKARKIESKHREILDKFSCAFQHVFWLFAVISAVFIIYSKCPYIENNHWITLFLLFPTGFLFIFFVVYYRVIDKDVVILDKEIKKHRIDLIKARTLMKEIISPRNKKEKK